MMNSQSPTSLQKIPLRRNLQRSQSVSERLNFPNRGDSNIFWGVGRKYFGGIEDTIVFQRPVQLNPEGSIRRSVSVRNIMNVADIEGATPSVAPDKVKNIARAKNSQQSSNLFSRYDVLGQMEKIFALKKISQIHTPQPVVHRQSGVAVSPESVSPRRYNPTFITTLSLHH